MEKLLIVLIIVAAIIGIVSSFFSREKIQRYVKDKKGNLVSTERAYPSNPKNHSLRVKYFDRHKNLRQVIYHENGLFSLFGDDEIIEYSRDSPEYKQLEEKLYDLDKKSQGFNKKIYKVKDVELSIKQEFTNPNVGEYVLVNEKLAPNGKYKLGFMNYISVENGKIKQISMM